MVEVKEENKADGYASNGDGGNNTGGGGNTSSASSTAGKQLEPEQFRKLFIGGLSLSTTDEGLKQFYSQFGELLDCVVMRDSQTKKSRGFGFVSFSTKEEVDKAMSARPHEIDGKTVDPKRAVPRDQSSRSESNISTKRLYVSGVREEHKEDDFSAYFSTFGNVLKVEIITDKVTEKPRGFAFVSFDDYDAVDKCVLQKSHMINNYRCDVKKALSKDDMARAQQMDRDRQDRGARSRGNQRNGPWQGVGGAGPGARGGGYGRDAGGGGYGSWGGGPPTGSSWGGPASQWGPGGAYGGAGGYGGYGGGYGAGGGAGGGWGAGGAAAGGPPPASWGAAGGASGGVGGAGAAGAWGSAGSWSSDASAAGWGTAQGTGGGAPAGQWAGATGGGWPTGAPAGASGPPGGAPGRF